MIVLSKTGYDHLDLGKNRQDIAFVTGNGKILFGDEKKFDFNETLCMMENPIKFVLDGCSSSYHSEVGVALFAQYFAEQSYDSAGKNFDFEASFMTTMSRLAHCVIDSDKFRFDNLCFTVLACFETETDFIVKYCGDGFIIAITQYGKIEIIQLNDAVLREDGEYPTYPIYQYIRDQKSLLLEHRKGVELKTSIFPKKLYSGVGIATDGWRYIDRLDTIERIRWDENILADKTGNLSKIVNKNILKFRDDISVCI